MYEFPEELRKAYESLTIPLIFMAYEGGESIPLLVSDGMLGFMGVTRELLELYNLKSLGGNLFETLHPEDTGRIRDISAAFFNGQTDFDVIFRARMSDGYHTIHAVGHWQPLEGKVQLATIIFVDMVRHADIASKIVEKYSLFQSDDFYTDSLTNLPNTNYFNKYSEDRATNIKILTGAPVILFYDVDSMQSYNVSYGTRKGDELLVLVAKILCEEFPNAQVTRAADDHFVVLDKYDGKPELIEKVKRINQRVKDEAFGSTTGTHVGICVLKSNMTAKEALDHAKHASKILGKNLNICYRFYSERDNYEFLNQRYIIENFYKAMNNNYIKVYYQGLMRVETGKGAGFECLARWEDPERGVIYPSEFIPALEQYHLMHDLDLFMFEQVCREIGLRVDVGLPLLPVSINFSRQDFDYVDVVGELNRIYDKYKIDQYGIDKSWFMIEITEQDMATATDDFNKQLKEIRKSGYRLWIDDFGSGYSSLNVFSNYDIDLIKFDMDLLRNLDKHKGANRIIIAAFVDVAKKLGIHTLCEGLETEEQLQFLKDCGCELAQGYLYHKPEGLGTIFERLGLGIPIPEWETSEERKALAEKWAKEVK